MTESFIKKAVNLVKINYAYHFHRFVLDELIFFITSQCNFRCKTCFYGKQMDAPVSVLSNELSIDEIKKISSSLGRLNKLLISGGEPFLRDDLPEICQIFYQQNQVNSIHLPTNGFYPDKISQGILRILNFCPDIHLTVSFSLDGMQTTHNYIKGNKESFQKTVESVKKTALLKKQFSNLYLYIITVVNKTNLHEVVSLSEFVKNELPVDAHGPSPMRGIPYDDLLLPPDANEWNNLSKLLLEYQRYWCKKSNSSKKSTAAFAQVQYLYRLYTQILGGGQLPFRCQAGNIIGVLESNGEVRLCELSEVIGDVHSTNYDFKKVWFSKKAERMRERIKSCTCTHACFLSPSIRFSLSLQLRRFFLAN